MKTRITMVLALILVAVPTFSQKTDIDFDHEADFSKYETYAFVTGTPVPNPLMDQRIANAVEYHLTMNGYREVESDPDMYVTYHASAQEQKQFVTDNFGYGPGPGWGWGGGMGTSTTRAYTIEKATLVIDIWDAKEKKLLWRGTGTDTVSDKPEKNEKKINKVCDKLFKEFPPKPKK